MSPEIPHRFAAIATLFLLMLIPVLAADTPPTTAAKETGDLWESTSQMSMAGMPMALPAQTRKICAPREWKEPPAGTDERQKCQNSDFKAVGPKATWKVICAGPPAMTGEGEITRNGADAYTGQIRFSSAEGAMTIKLTGKRVGPCDPDKK